MFREQRISMAETRFIVAGRLIDGSGGPVQRQVFLAVRQGGITGIGPASGLPAGTPQTAITDLSHCTILPSLVDSSTCLSRSPSVDRAVRASMAGADATARMAMLARHVHYCHAYGVLGVADGDDATGLVTRYRQEKEATIEIRASGPLCRTLQDCGKEAPTRDFLKIACSGDIAIREEPSPGPGQEELCRMLSCRGGRKAVVVANGRRRVAEALAAGCDAIEQGYGMGEDNLRLMAERDILWIPCVVRARNGLDGAVGDGGVACRFSQRYISPEKPVPGAEAFWKETLAGQLAQLRLARKLGVRTAVGTGAGGVGILHGESMVEEMKLFLRAGYTLEETIRSASEHGARFFGMDGLGMLAPGRRATFLAVRGTVKQLPRKLSYLEDIYIDGRPSTAYRKV